MAKKQMNLEVAFFRYLWVFYSHNRGAIKQHYRLLTRKFLDYNDVENPDAFLRRPQFEALEMYVFLKEYANNRHMHSLFEDWYFKKNGFEKRVEISKEIGQGSLFDELDPAVYKATFSFIKKFERAYPNYIFALTMGTGKTILMATCIFYEFLLANKFPKDKLYCHNALVFAPDKTVLQSLKEIQTFDKRKVVPPEYVNWLESNLKFHFLEDSGTTLQTIDRSKFNIVISNTQKIILKQKHAVKPAAQEFFERVGRDSVMSEFADLFKIEGPEDEKELAVNQRFLKLQRLEQLGIYVDEAHHAFGSQLQKDLYGNNKTSLRVTIDILAESLKLTGTTVVGCYNYTGTPYVGNQVLPEVVYAYGLKAAIDNAYLKRVVLNGYRNPKSKEFVRETIADFWSKFGADGKRHEGMLPKLAFFAPTIEELQKELRPVVEEVLAELGIDTNKILVNVGDPKLTGNDEIREFNLLDSAGSDKQFILLVNKGREGWNCRSLFGVAMFRKPKSKIFVLQATMRCLRSIGEGQQTGNVYLSEDNMKILDAELQQNYRLTLEQFRSAGVSDKNEVEIRVKEPPKRIKIKRIKSIAKIQERDNVEGVAFNFEEANLEQYKFVRITQEGLKMHEMERVKRTEEDISDRRIQRQYSVLTLVGEISRYLNLSPLQIEEILRTSVEGTDKVLEMVNQYNDLIYDWIIKRIFDALYEIEVFQNETEEEVQLAKIPESGYYLFNANPKFVVREMDENMKVFSKKSFHLDTYCFASEPERIFFEKVIVNDNIEEVYFTGMLTHGQSDFKVYYIDPDSHVVRSYYPDFLVKRKDGKMFMVEVKADFQIDDSVVKAKRDSAHLVAEASQMSYELIPSSSIEKGGWRRVIN